MTPILYVNGSGIDEFGLVPVGLGAAWSTPPEERPATSLAGRVGVRSSAVAGSGRKVIPLALELPAEVAERRGALNAALWRLDGLLILEWSDAPGIYQLGRVPVKTVRAAYEPMAYVEGDLYLEVPVELDNPYAYAWELTSVAIGTTPIGVPLGTGVSSPIIELYGPVDSEVTITYRGIDGLTPDPFVVSDPNLSGTDDALIIDSDLGRIYAWDGSSLTDVTSLWSDGPFPQLDPGDGNPDAGSWPTLASTHNGTVRYQKAYE